MSSIFISALLLKKGSSSYADIDGLRKLHGMAVFPAEAACADYTRTFLLSSHLRGLRVITPGPYKVLRRKRNVYLI